MYQAFYIDKTTGTFADEFYEVAGFLRLCWRNYSFSKGWLIQQIVQTDCGHYYQIQVQPALDTACLDEKANPFVLAPILRTTKNKTQLPDLPDDSFYVVDYEVEKEKRDIFFTAYGDLESTLKRAYAIGDDDNFPLLFTGCTP